MQVKPFKPKWPTALYNSGFCSIKQLLGVFLPPLPRRWDASPSQVTLQAVPCQAVPNKLAFTQLYSLLERGTVRVQEHNAVPQPKLQSEPFDPESNTRTIRPLCLPHTFVFVKKIGNCISLIMISFSRLTKTCVKGQFALGLFS